MTFLNPAVLFGLLAASIPVLIHLLNLRKLKKIEFSTIVFLKELQKNKIRKIKLKQWLLLALRVLIILVLVLAFARPALRGTTIAGAGSTAKTTAIFIIDDTFSMSVIGSRGSYLNQAKQTVKQLIKQLQEGDEAALILVSDKNKSADLTSNLTDFAKRVDAVELSYSSGIIHDAVVKAANLISESHNFNKEIYLLSDFQQDRIYNANTLSDFSEVFNKNIKLYAFNYSGKDVYNLAVTDFNLQTQIFEKDKPVSLDVTVNNFSRTDAEDVVISLFVNGERSSQKSIDIPSGGSVTTDVEVTLNNTGYLNFSAEIQDDEILQDNRRFLSVNIPSEIPVLIVSENENDTRYVELALSSAGENNPLRITKKNTGQLSSVNLSQFKAVIISASGNVNGLDKIRSFAENGGGVIVMPSSTASPETFNIFIKDLGIPQSEGAAGIKGTQSASARFGSIDFDHPVFQNLFLNERKKTESPDIYYYFRVKPSGKGRDIISLYDGSSFMSEYASGSGKIILFSSLLSPSWNNFVMKGLFAPLIYKTILYASFSRNNPEKHFAGDPVLVNLKGRSVPQIKVLRPDGASENLNTGGMDYVNYTGTSTAGIYSLISNEQVFGKIDINTDPAESQTTYMKPSDFRTGYLDKIGFKGDFVNIEPDGNAAGQILQARFGSELWKFLIVITLLLALAEMAIARNLKKETVDLNRSF